ncbi:MULTISPECIES: SDR family NAD(P)-dependent oxidoreductase [Streptomyces]|uniref:SDR family NAD(P)-dependent oxidoreductase n=1 Tax=Streptomyces ramulosus TaxID=47762 RepID=A0ABW1FA10_9ACTN
MTPVPDTPDETNQVAIIGMAGRFPGAPDVDAFWQHLAAGRETVSALTDEELLASGVTPEELDGDHYVKAKGVLEDGDRFDAAFFGYSPREAELMDPQHRVFLECAWQALESAGIDPATAGGRIGVFGGASLNSYLLFNILQNRRYFEATGIYRTLLASDKDFLATRVAYKFDLTGPAVTVQTACSTSLTAVHLACQSLLNGECDIALAGGVSVSAPLKSGHVHEPGGILSADGHCRPFDAAAGGTVPGNGAGLVVLRRLADAQGAGDRIDAVIRGTAVNNDGALKAGYTAPSVEGQAEVIAEALAVADVDPATVGYVETHGTGTALGDPIEIAALTRAYREHTDATGYCTLGAVKSNVGHLDAAAGITALIKATLALRHEAIPATAHFSAPNPELDLDKSPFRVSGDLTPWPRGDEPRRAGVSAFGIGGTNVHVVLEEAPPAPAAPPAAPAGAPRLLPLSAASPQALADNAARLADHLEAHPDTGLDALAHTLTHRRRAFGHRAAVVGATAAEAAAALRALTPADAVAAPERPAPVAFLFPGQGSQYVAMARGLHDSEPAFAAELDRCAELFTPHLGTDLRTVLFAPDAEAADAAARLERTALTQPVLFSVEYALARLWNAWGVTPKAMVGHSIGEFAAACLAGVLSLEDAVRLVAARGALVEAMEPGAMLSVFLSEEQTLARIAGDDALCLAAANSSELSVVSGPEDAIERLRTALTADGVACRRLHTSHAFHSPSMDGAIDPFVDEVRKVALHPPRIPYLSNVTGTWITDAEATDPAYWGAHLRRPVRFADALDVLLADPDLVLLEVGPGQTLGNFVRQHRAFREGRTVRGSLRHPNEPADDRAHLLAGLGALWSAGVPAARPSATAPGDRPPLPLPPYAFARDRYWVEPDQAPAPADRPGATAPTSLDDWFHTPGWTRLAPDAARPPQDSDAVWAVLGTDLPLGRDLARRLGDDGARVIGVAAGRGLHHDGDSWALDPADRDHFAELLTALDATGAARLRLVHVWSTGCGPDGPLDEARLGRARRAGFDSLLALGGALADRRGAAPVTLDTVCRGVHAVTGDEALQPEHALLLGASTVLPQEITGVSCRTLDVTGTDPHGPADPALRALMELLRRPTDARDLALRGTHWWARGFDAVPLTAPEAAPQPPARLRDNGVYLLTGGLGGIALALADHLAQSVRNPAIGLLTRSEFPAEETWDDHVAAHGPQDPTSVRIGRLRRLQEAGARVVVLRADVTDEAATATAVAALRDRHGPLNGLVHAAGVPSRGMVMNKTGADADAVLAAKTRGTLVLDRVCAADPLDFVLLCSSLTAVLGGPGQSDYAAANAFLDAYAQHKRAEGTTAVVSVGWDTWRGVGMAAGLAEQLGGGPGGEPTGQPLLQRLLETTDTGRTHLTTLTTAGSWIVDDHRIMGQGLVPGTTYLELVRAAVAEQAAGRVIELQDVLFALPVIVPDGQSRDLYTTVEERDGATRFTVRSRTTEPGGDGWQTHAVGTVAFHDRTETPVRDLDALRRDLAGARTVTDQDELKRLFKLDLMEQGGRIDFTLGPRWRCLKGVHVGDGRLLVELRLDDAFLADLDGYPLHPALLDVAGVSARIQMADGYYLPFTYRSLEIAAPLTAALTCDVTLKGSPDGGSTLTCDIDILGPAGELLVRIGDFTLKRINDVDGMIAQIERAVGEQSGPGATEPAAAPTTLQLLGEGISEADGRVAFARILSAADGPGLPAHLVVTHHDLDEVRRLAAALTPETLARESAALAPLAGTHPRPDLDIPYVAPATEDERAVAAVWQEVLGVDRAGVNDPFFALGGHSLAAVQIGTKLQSHFGTELDLRAFFDDPTIARTVTLLTAAPAAADTIEALSRDDDQLPDADRLDDLSDAEVEAELARLLAEETDEDRS